MKGDMKIVATLLSVVILYVASTDGFVRVRVRIPSPVRIVRRVGRVVKTGVRKAGEGIKTGVRKAGEGLKKAGEGIKKAGEVTGKHLYKGLRESGKALITASSTVSDILDRINVVKFIWKKLGACCTFDPALCRAKREYERVQKRLKYYNKDIDVKWRQVESVYQWIVKINENVEDIGYHVERLTSGIKDSVQPLLPPLIIQYNNKMNAIKQDVKWKNASVVHLTRQGVTTFVSIEMAWQCGKVASSVRDGLKDLKEARDKCVTILRESNDLLRFFEKGWRQLKSALASPTLRKQLEDIKALCQDLRQSSCVSTIDKYLRQITNANHGTTFGLQEDIINLLATIKYTFSCLKRKQRVISTVSEHCQKGNENFHTVFLQAVQDFFPNKDLCTGLESKDYTTKDIVLEELRIIANREKFYSSCELNNREVVTRTCLNYSSMARTHNLPPLERSRLLQDCETIVPSFAEKCQVGLCQNGGRCQQKSNSYSCVCTQGFEGEHCETKTAHSDIKVLKIEVRSEGCDDKHRTKACGLAIIKVNGQDYSKHGRGYNFVVLDGNTGKIESQVYFDTHANVWNVNNMIKFIKGISPSKIVLVAIQDEGKRSMNSDAYKTLLTIGAVEPMKRDYRGSFALIGVSGNTKPRFVKQVDNLRRRGPSIVKGIIALPYTVCPNANELGMRNGKIRDSQITASSEWNHNHGANNARLYFRAHNGRTGAWSAKVNDVHQWIQTDFKTSTVVAAISIQGREDCCNQFVKTYTVSWSNDGKIFYPYKHQGKDKVFTGNNDKRIVVQHIMSPPIIARYIRINPMSWNDHISLRLEFSGWKASSFPDCTNPGLANVKVLKLQVRSEACDDKHRTKACGLAIIKVNGQDYSKHGRGYNFVVLDGNTGTIESQVYFDTHANVGNVNNMIKFIRGTSPSKIFLVAIQDEGKRSMTSDAYKSLLTIGAVEPMKRDYRGSFALIGVSGNTKPRFVKQVDNLRSKGPSIVEEIITLPYTVCQNANELGMRNGKIQDSQITASSEWNHNHGANNARLYFRAHNGRTGAWSAKFNDVHQWIQTDFKTSTVVAAISIQGREDCCNQFVKTYTVSWSNDGRIFYLYKHEGKDKVFTGNNDKRTVVQEIISPPIIARYIRINPKSWNHHISLRLEFSGCYK